MKLKKADAAWAHGTELDQDGKKVVRCNYCLKVVSGITRLKYHLAKVGGDVKPCPSVPKNVYHEFFKYFPEHPYRTVFKTNKNQDRGESSLAAGGQSSHQKTSRDAQTEDDRSCQRHKAALPHQGIVFVDLDPDIEVSIKAKREDINQMAAHMIHLRKMKKKHVEGSSPAGKTTPSLKPFQKKANMEISVSNKLDKALDLCKGKESQPMSGIHTTDNLAFMASNSSVETGPSTCNGFLFPSDRTTIIFAEATAEKAKSNEALIQEAETAQKNMSLIIKSYKEYRLMVKAEQEQFRKIQQIIGQQLTEKVQEVEAKNKELGSLRAALDAKEKKMEGFQATLEAKQRELAAMDHEMERLRRAALAAQAEWYLHGRDEIIVKAKEVGLNHKLLLPDPADDPTELLPLYFDALD